MGKPEKSVVHTLYKILDTIDTLPANYFTFEEVDDFKAALEIAVDSLRARSRMAYARPRITVQPRQRHLNRSPQPAIEGMPQNETNSEE